MHICTIACTRAQAPRLLVLLVLLLVLLWLVLLLLLLLVRCWWAENEPRARLPH